MTNIKTTDKAKGASLKWSETDEQAWRRVLRACNRAASTHSGGRCVLRSILSVHLRVPTRQPYDDLRRHLYSLSSEAGISVLDGFDAFWDGARRGFLKHHDSTLIHFSDSGRLLLAQLTLGALPHILNSSLGAQVLPSVRWNNTLVFY